MRTRTSTSSTSSGSPDFSAQLRSAFGAARGFAARHLNLSVPEVLIDVIFLCWLPPSARLRKGDVPKR